MEPQVLRLTGVEVQIELYRGMTSTFDAFLTYADGKPVDISDKKVVLKIADKVVAGSLKYTQTNEPNTHVNGPGGQTRFSIPPTVTAELTDDRSYTWKYLIYMQDPTTSSTWPFFHGDARVLVPNALLASTAPPPTITSLDVSVGEDVGTGDSF